MKILTFLFDPSPIKTMRNSFKQAIKKKNSQIENDIIRFNDFDAISGILSASKMKLFNCILNEKPNSLYELAKIMNKDQSQILREVKVLANLGVINLIQEKEGLKEKIKPIAIYDEIKIKFKEDISSKIAV